MTPERTIYLDHNATTALRPAAAAAIGDVLGLVGNPSSIHRHGRAVRRVIEDARDQVATMVGVAPAAVIFTSGGTEANALALRGAGRERVLVSAVEHASVLDAVSGAERIPVDADGVIVLDALDEMLAADSCPAIVSVMLANNETGVIQPIHAVADIAARHGALVHCDAVQAAGKMAVEFGRLGADLLSLSAHKLGGPSGVGALVVGGAATVSAQLRGGGQERRRRAGTENLLGIAGFGAAAEAVGDAAQAAATMARLRFRLEAAIGETAPCARIIGAGGDRLANTTCAVVPGIAGETLVMALDLAGVAISAGSACSSGKVSASHVLGAMGLGEDLARSGIRISTGWSNSEQDIDHFVAVWRKIAKRLGFAGQAGGVAAMTEAA